MTFELGASVFSMGLYIYKWEKYRKYIFLVVYLGAKPFENFSLPLKVKIFFSKYVWFMVYVRSVLAIQKECSKN